jgi:lipopolysaccharide export system permease protein
MLRIIDRYLLSELAMSFFASALLLLLVTLGGVVADLVGKIARGRVPADLMLALIGLRIVDALTILLPLAVFLAVLLAFGRLYRDSEMAVFAASGLNITGLLRPLLLLALPTMIVLAAISFWLAPASVRMSQTLQQEASRSLIVAGLEPGHFVDMPNRNGVIYVANMSPDGTHFDHFFVVSEQKNKDGNAEISITTAANGEMYHEADGIGRYLRLNNGFRVEGVLGQDNFRLLRYERNDPKLPDSDVDGDQDSIKRSAPTSVLLASNDPVQRAELHWRLAAPIEALVLMLLALPLSRTSPREPRFAKLLVGLLTYFIYYTGLTLSRSWIAQGKLPAAFGCWWVHIPTLALALWLLWRSQQMRKPRAPARLAAATP